MGILVCIPHSKQVQAVSGLPSLWLVGAADPADMFPTMRVDDVDSFCIICGARDAAYTQAVLMSLV